MVAAGTFFPHDEFYDTSTREIVGAISSLAEQNAVAACETPELFEYYANKISGRNLKFVSLSDKKSVAALRTGDMIVITRGRRYFSNSAYEEYLKTSAIPSAEFKVLGTTSALIYKLDETTLAGILAIAKQ